MAPTDLTSQKTVAHTPLRLATFELFGQYTRADIFGHFGIVFSQRNRHQIRGLSPVLPGGSYCIFITLDKGTIDARYDYEDELYRHELIWVTRGGTTEHQPEYVAMRSGAPVSLFARRRNRDPFTYLGELAYVRHRQFTNDEGRSQQEYVFALPVELPGDVYEALVAGVRTPGRQTTGPAEDATTASSRRAAVMDRLRQSYAYALDRTIRGEPRHQHYQVRLTQFLAERGITAVCEEDFVDVKFTFGDALYVGEVKVTSGLSAQEAFRTALGQILEYAHLRFSEPPAMLIFLDAMPDQKRVDLAARLGISVIVETDGAFVLLAPTSEAPHATLRSVFPAP